MPMSGVLGRCLERAAGKGLAVRLEFGALGDTRMLLRAFPAALRGDVTAVVGVMPPPGHPAAKRRERVLARGEAIEIPYRIYNPEPPADAVAWMSDRQKVIVGCVYSRHHDGHVRERYCAHIVESTEPWVIPFVVQLLGEYVGERLLLELLLPRPVRKARLSRDCGTQPAPRRCTVSKSCNAALLFGVDAGVGATSS
jgi:hypothetical protein